jgi:hypothetical protein
METDYVRNTWACIGRVIVTAIRGDEKNHEGRDAGGKAVRAMRRLRKTYPDMAARGYLSEDFFIESRVRSCTRVKCLICEAVEGEGRGPQPHEKRTRDSRESSETPLRRQSRLLSGKYCEVH